MYRLRFKATRHVFVINLGRFELEHKIRDLPVEGTGGDDVIPIPPVDVRCTFGMPKQCLKVK
eukprot:5576055-Karenia_brevis.AAC.1